jgi:hypothetical protein
LVTLVDHKMINTKYKTSQLRFCGIQSLKKKYLQAGNDT